METINLNNKNDYRMMLKQTQALLEGERDVIPNLANASALLNAGLSDINWAGFYLINQGELLLGPFQGNVACVHIVLGRGVCGTAAQRNETVIVPDVHEFPGHIACDSASNSEIVIPIHDGENVVGVLDIDSPLKGRFHELDAKGLEQIARVIEQACDWQTICHK
jgi:L-methionine (R)-S-oxide reductase